MRLSPNLFLPCSSRWSSNKPLVTFGLVFNQISLNNRLLMLVIFASNLSPEINLFLNIFNMPKSCRFIGCYQRTSLKCWLCYLRSSWSWPRLCYASHCYIKFPHLTFFSQSSCSIAFLWVTTHNKNSFFQFFPPYCLYNYPWSCYSWWLWTRRSWIFLLEFRTSRPYPVIRLWWTTCSMPSQICSQLLNLRKIIL